VGENVDKYIGGVLANFDYMTAVNPDFSLLTDVNSAAIDHLAFVLFCLKDLDKDNPSQNLEQFLGNVANLRMKEPDAREMFGQDSKGRTVSTSLYEDPCKRAYTFDRFKAYLDRLTPEEVNRSWFAQPEKIRAAFEAGRIKAYQGDLFKQGKNVARTVIETTGTKHPLFYLSDIRAGSVRDLLVGAVGEADPESLILVNNRTVHKFKKNAAGTMKEPPQPLDLLGQ
jgi:hypothetical protein